MKPLDALTAALARYRRSVLALAAADQAELKAATVASGEALKASKHPVARAEAERREARRALHRIAEAAALNGLALVASSPALHVHPAAGVFTAEATPAPAHVAPARNVPARAKAPTSGSAGERLRAWIQAEGLTFAEAGAQLGVAHSSISRWCAGGRVPSPAERERIAQLAGIEAEAWADLKRERRRARALAGAR